MKKIIEVMQIIITILVICFIIFISLKTIYDRTATITKRTLANGQIIYRIKKQNI